MNKSSICHRKVKNQKEKNDNAERNDADRSSARAGGVAEDNESAVLTVLDISFETRFLFEGLYSGKQILNSTY